MSSRPTIALVATGGTIAGRSASAVDTSGYVAGSIPAVELLDAVPQITAIAHIRTEQLCNIDSKDMTPEIWLRLAHRTRALLADPQIDGVVITHGTDTMEETATFLDLVHDSAKPVVLTGSMRPATALAADGPMNLFDAVATATDPGSKARGVMLVFAESIFPGRGLRKSHSSRLDAFSAVGAPLGRTRPRVHYYHPAGARSDPAPLPPPDTRLPRVDIVYVAAGSAPALAEAAVADGARGLVLALPGNGSVPDAWIDTITRMVASGVPVVRASRCGEGTVSARALDRQAGSWPAGMLSPAAARVALMLGLSAQRGRDSVVLADFMFNAGSPEHG